MYESLHLFFFIYQFHVVKYKNTGFSSHMGNDDHTILLKELRKRAAAYKYIHWTAFGFKQRIYYCLNIPVTLLSCFTTAMTFYDIKSSTGSDLTLQIIMGVIEVIILALSAMSTFLKCGQKSSGHQHTYRDYEEFILNIDRLIADSSIMDEIEISEKYNHLLDKYSQILNTGETVSLQDLKRLDSKFNQQRVSNKDLITGDMCV